MIIRRTITKTQTTKIPQCEMKTLLKLHPTSTQTPTTMITATIAQILQTRHPITFNTQGDRVIRNSKASKILSQKVSLPTAEDHPILCLKKKHSKKKSSWPRNSSNKRAQTMVNRDLRVQRESYKLREYYRLKKSRRGHHCHFLKIFHWFLLSHKKKPKCNKNHLDVFLSSPRKSLMLQTS